MTIKSKASILIFLSGTVLALLGVLIYVLGWAGVEGTVFHTRTINYFGKYNWTFVEIDIYKYLKGLETSLELEQFNYLTINVPDLPKTPAANDVLGWLSYIGKILAVFIPNIMIMLINIIITPYKLILYPVKILTALLGLNLVDNGLITFTNMIYSFNIPFIPYW